MFLRSRAKNSGVMRGQEPSSTRMRHSGSFDVQVSNTFRVSLFESINK
jgi:hypothetical protein